MDSKTYKIKTVFSHNPYREEMVEYSEAEKDRFEKEASEWRRIQVWDIGQFENDYIELFKTARIKHCNIHPISWESLVIEDGKAVGIWEHFGHYSIYDGAGGSRGWDMKLYFSEYEQIVKNRKEYHYYSCDRDGTTSHYTFILPMSVIDSIPEFIMDGTTLVLYTGEAKHVIIPEGVETIGVDSFSLCKCIEEVTFPSSLKAIEKNAFYSCDKLKKADFPKGTNVSEKAFDYTPLQTRTISHSYKEETIEDYYRDRN